MSHGGGGRKGPKKCHVLFEWPLKTEFLLKGLTPDMLNEYLLIFFSQVTSQSLTISKLIENGGVLHTKLLVIDRLEQQLKSNFLKLETKQK